MLCNVLCTRVIGHSTCICVQHWHNVGADYSTETWYGTDTITLISLYKWQVKCRVWFKKCTYLFIDNYYLCHTLWSTLWNCHLMKFLSIINFFSFSRFLKNSKYSCRRNWETIIEYNKIFNSKKFLNEAIFWWKSLNDIFNNFSNEFLNQ